MITWLASYPKSGNTWFRLLLNGYYTGKADINAMAFCLGDNDMYFHQSLCPRGGLSQGEVALLRPAALLHMTAAVGTRPLFVKTHHANCTMDGIPAIPDTLTHAAIYLVRDPRDVAISSARHFGLEVDDAITMLGDQKRAIGDDPAFIHCISDWTTHVRSWTGGKMAFPVLGVRYESLKEDPEFVLSKILGKIGEDVDETKVKNAVKLCHLDRMKGQEALSGFKERPKQCSKFFVGSNWEKELTEAQIHQIELDHGEEMVKHGYATVTLQNRDAG